MKIHFCALCNESVPQSALDSGAARYVKDRLICATCDAAMSHTADGAHDPVSHPQQVSRGNAPHVPHEVARHVAHPSHAGVAALAPAHEQGPHAPYMPPPPVRESPAASPSGSNTAGSNTGLAWVAGLAIGFTALSIFVTDDRLARMGREQAVLQKQLAEKEDALHGLATEFAKIHPALADVDVRLSGQLDEQRRQSADILALLTTVRDEAGRSSARVDGLQSELETIQKRLAQPGLGVELEKRLGELSARIAKGEDERRALTAELAAAAKAAPSEPTQAAGPTPIAAPPAWTRNVADLKSKEETVRWDAVTTLGATNDPAVVPHLLPMLEDPTWLVRMAAARVLGEMKVREAVPALITMLDDVESAARETAWSALRAITGKDLKFDPFASDAERAKRVKAWSDWWKKEGGADAAKAPSSS